MELLVDVGPEAKLEQAINHGKHPSPHEFVDEVMPEARADVAKGRVTVFHVERAGGIGGLRAPPTGVVNPKAKRENIHDMTFAASEGGSEESTNNSTD